MIERSERLGLEVKPGARLGLTRGLFAQKLERDEALEARVAGEEDLSHAARAELSQNAVPTDLLAHRASLSGRVNRERPDEGEPRAPFASGTKLASSARVTSAVRASHLLGFFAFSHGWTWLFWAVGAVVSPSIWEMPGLIFLVVGGAGVPIGAVVMTGIAGGRRGLTDLGRRTVDPRPIALRWWAAILLLAPAATLAGAGLAYVSGATASPVDLEPTAARLGDPAALLAFVLFTLIIGPLPEEIGWRGYLLDRLQGRQSALVASLIVGLIWWSWHLPLFWLPGYFDAFTRAEPTPWEFLGIVPVAVVYTWVYNNTDRSVFAVIVLHLMQNLSGEALGLADEARIHQTLATTAISVIVVLGWGAKTLRREGARSARS